MEFIESTTIGLKVDGRLYENIGSPRQRSVFILEDCVVKVDCLSPKSSLQRQSARELDFWRTLTEDKEYFAEILDFGITPKGRFWVKYKKYATDGGFEFDTHTHIWEKMRDLVFKYGLNEMEFDFEPSEDGNWFVVGGEPLLYDYGI